MDTVYVPSLSISLPRLGYGCMRLPADDGGAIEIKPALELLHNALDNGVNLFDTAYIYNEGKNEPFLGQHFFATLPRERFMVSTKLPVYMVKELGQCEELFAEQLRRLHVEHIDFYLAHSLSLKSWQKFRALGGAGYLEQLRQQGRARFVGFSWHGEPEDLAAVMDDFAWDFVLLQLNYYDWAEQVQNAELQYAITAARNLPLFVMEPVRGGSLAKLPQPAMELLQSINPAAAPAQWALRWAGSLPAVTTVFSGMSSAEQLAQNLNLFSDFAPLGPAEQQALAAVRRILCEQPHVPCTGCDYCREHCPVGINIGHAFADYNDYLRLDDPRILRNYLSFTRAEQRATCCTGCGGCKPYCPQKLDIPGQLACMNDALVELIH